MASRVISGQEFRFICVIKPQADASGSIREFTPQASYRNSKGIPLNPHGNGPFCKFSVTNAPREAGVYALILDGAVTYIGEYENLRERFGPRGYGTISPRNCFAGGQPANCKINRFVLINSKAGRSVELWFTQTSTRKELETRLIKSLAPAWNSQAK